MSATLTLTFVLFTGGVTFERTHLARGQFFEDSDSNITDTGTNITDTGTKQNVQKTYWYTIFDYGEIDGFEADSNSIAQSNEITPTTDTITPDKKAESNNQDSGNIGQEWNTTQQTQSNQSSGVLMKYKGNYYCYDSATIEKKEVINSIKNDEVSSVQEMVNKFLTSMVEDKDLGLTVATGGCQNMVSQGSITNEDYHDEGIVLEGTLTLENEK